MPPQCALCYDWESGRRLTRYRALACASGADRCARSDVSLSALGECSSAQDAATQSATTFVMLCRHTSFGTLSLSIIDDEQDRLMEN